MPKTLVDEYLSGATLLRQAVAGMSREPLAARPVPGKWSTLEVLCHLADMEGVFSDRIKQVLAEDSPPLPNADEKLWFAALAYQDREAAEEISLIDLQRRQMAHVLRSLPEAAWQRTGRHSVAGLLTLEQIVGKAVMHLEHHRKFILEKRQALGL